MGAAGGDAHVSGLLIDDLEQMMWKNTSRVLLQAFQRGYRKLPRLEDVPDAHLLPTVGILDQLLLLLLLPKLLPLLVGGWRADGVSATAADSIGGKAQCWKISTVQQTGAEA